MKPPERILCRARRRARHSRRRISPWRLLLLYAGPSTACPTRQRSPHDKGSHLRVAAAGGLVRRDATEHLPCVCPGSWPRRGGLVVAGRRLLYGRAGDDVSPPAAVGCGIVLLAHVTERCLVSIPRAVWGRPSASRPLQVARFLFVSTCVDPVRSSFF